jgi:hypothetical protein
MNTRHAALGLGALLATATVAESQAARKPRPAAARPAAKPAAAPAPSVSVVGVKVLTAAIQRDSSDVGTRVALALQVPPPAGIVAIDTGESRVEEMRDSSGRALEGPEFYFSTNIAKSGQAATLEIRADGVPVPEATAVSARGTLKVTVSSGFRTEKVAAVRLQKGATFRLGGGAFTVDEVEAGEDAVTAKFKGPGAVLRKVKEIRFTRAGAAVEASQWGSSTSGDEGEMSYRITGKGGTFALSADLWQEPQALSVPVDVKTGLAVAR